LNQKIQSIRSSHLPESQHNAENMDQDIASITTGKITLRHTRHCDAARGKNSKILAQSIQIVHMSFHHYALDI